MGVGEREGGPFFPPTLPAKIKQQYFVLEGGKGREEKERGKKGDRKEERMKKKKRIKRWEKKE